MREGGRGGEIEEKEREGYHPCAYLGRYAVITSNVRQEVAGEV